MLSVKCCLKAKRKKNMKKRLINKNLAGFVTFYFALKGLLTYDLRIRNTDPCLHLVSCYKKHV